MSATCNAFKKGIVHLPLQLLKGIRFRNQNDKPGIAAPFPLSRIARCFQNINPSLLSARQVTLLKDGQLSAGLLRRTPHPRTQPAANSIRSGFPETPTNPASGYQILTTFWWEIGFSKNMISRQICLKSH